MRGTKLGEVQGFKTIAEDFDDLWCERLRERYIKQGLIKPPTQKYNRWERPHMMAEHVEALRQKYIEQGLIKPRRTYAFQERSPAKEISSHGGHGGNLEGDLRRMGSQDRLN